MQMGDSIEYCTVVHCQEEECIVYINCQEEGCIDPVHCREEGCIGLYIPVDQEIYLEVRGDVHCTTHYIPTQGVYDYSLLGEGAK